MEGFLPRRGFIPPLSAKIRLTPKQRVITEWRRINLLETETARRDNTRSAGQVLPAVLKQVSLEKKQADLEILKVWNSFQDPVIVRHATPVGIAHGTLFVRVDSNVWLAEIVRYRRFEILRRLQHAFGEDKIRKISFRVA